MCKWGTNVILSVPIPANLSHTGEFRWDIKGVDSCIAPIVDALNKGGVFTSNSCCGHENGPGVIFLHDGRSLVVHTEKYPYDQLKNEIKDFTDLLEHQCSGKSYSDYEEGISHGKSDCLEELKGILKKCGL